MNSRHWIEKAVRFRHFSGPGRMKPFVEPEATRGWGAFDDATKAWLIRQGLRPETQKRGSDD